METEEEEEEEIMPWKRGCQGRSGEREIPYQKARRKKELSACSILISCVPLPKNESVWKVRVNGVLLCSQ